MRTNTWWGEPERHRQAYYLGVQRRKERQAQAERTKIGGLPIVVSPDDISYSLALAAHSGTSWVPEDRARQVQQGYVEHMRALYRSFVPLATTPEKQEMLKRELEGYKRGYLKRETARLSAQSRVLSPMITGPSKFPTARNQKRLATEQKRSEELSSWMDKEQNKIRRLLSDRGPIRTEDPEAIQKLKKKLEGLEQKQEFMKEANKVVKNKKLSSQEKIKILAQMHPLNEALAVKLLQPDFAGRVGFAGYELTNNNSEIKRLKSRIEEVSRKKSQSSREYPFNGGRVVDNVEENRVQIFFDEKPSGGTRGTLKRYGFKWAPSVGAWQTYRSQAANYHVEIITTVRIPQENARKKENYWPGEPERHRQAALLGWKRRRDLLGTTRTKVVLTPTQTKYLPYLRGQVESGEAGKRMPKGEDTHTWIGIGSSYPEWMQNQGWGRDEVLRVFDLLESGRGFGERNVRQLHIADVIKFELQRVVRQEAHESRRITGAERRTGARMATGIRGRRGAPAGRAVPEEELPAWVLGNPGSIGVKVVPKFHSLPELSAWLTTRIRAHGGKGKYWSSKEYRKLYPEIKKQWVTLKNRNRG